MILVECIVKIRAGETQIYIGTHKYTQVCLWDHNIGYHSQSQSWKLTEKVSK